MNIRSKITGKQGFTLIEIMIVVAVIGLITAIAFPQFQKAKTTAAMNICIANLKRIEEGKDIWAVWEGKTASDTPAWDDLVSDYLKKTPACPRGGTYAINQMETRPVCTVEGHELPGS